MIASISTWPEDFLPTELQSETVRLPDGRRLGVRQAGDPDGETVFFFHGFGASRLSVHPDDEIAGSLGIRLVSVDRPGVGLSDALPGRRLMDWPRDAAQLADRLGVRRFAVLGCSTGGPHALACAVCLPERVTAVGLVGSAGPLSSPELRRSLTGAWRRLALAARWSPWLLFWYFRRYSQIVKRDPQGVMTRMLAELPETDRLLIRRQEHFTTTLSGMVEAVSHGGQGLLDDLSVVAKPWGFRPDELRQPVFLWHGEQDHAWPPAAGHYLASILPVCRAQFFPGEGPLIYLKYWGEILDTLRRSTQSGPVNLRRRGETGIMG